MIKSGVLIHCWAFCHCPSYLSSGCRLLSTGHEASQCLACEADHENEGALLEDVSRLLGDVRASVRCADLAFLWSDFCDSAETSACQLSCNALTCR